MSPPPMARRLEVGPFVARRRDDGEGWIVDAYEEGGALQVHGALIRDCDVPRLYALAVLMDYETKKKPRARRAKKGRAR